MTFEEAVAERERQITAQLIDEILRGDIMGNEELEIKDDAPGAAPVQGLGLGDIIKYGPVIQKVIQILTTGEGEFDVKVGGIRKHVAISNL